VLRVAVLADMLEEQWPSMDLVATSLVQQLRAQPDLGIEPLLVRPRLLPVSPPWARNGTPTTRDRVANRFWLYRRALRRVTGADVFHVIDHSYAHLSLHVAAGRSVVTCHDVDAFVEHAGDPRRPSGLPAFLVRRLVAGLRRAAVVACPSRATADAVIRHGLVPEERVIVVANGADIPLLADERISALTQPLLGPPGPDPELLNVGSSIPRKRIDVLLRAVAAVAESMPRTRLIRVGGPFTPEQESLVDALGIRDRIAVMPPLDAETLAAVYRRSTLLLATSEREGFGLPVAEALAAGTPVVASDLRVFREVAGAAAVYAACGDPDSFAHVTKGLLRERASRPAAWTERRAWARARGEAYSWARYGRDMAAIYERIAGSSDAGPEPRG